MHVGRFALRLRLAIASGLILLLLYPFTYAYTLTCLNKYVCICIVHLLITGQHKSHDLLKKDETSGYAMVVHGRPKTPKNTSFGGVTQPTGVAQPLYSRGHN